MPLSDDFIHQDRIAKHGDKGKPGYNLLHPNSLGSSYRTPKHEKTLERLGGLLQTGNIAEADALLQRTSSLTPSHRKIVAVELKQAKLRAKPKAKPKVREIKGMVPASEKVDLNAADVPVAALATPKGVTIEDAPGFLPPDNADDDPGAMASRYDSYIGMLASANTDEEVEVIEQEIEGMMGPGSPAYDDLQDRITAKYREHFERDRRYVAKWLAKRGIVRKHGNKGQPGYELLHPNSMLRGNRSDKQTKRLERLGAMLQQGDHDGAQALLDRTLNLTDDDKKTVQAQIHASKGGKDGGKSTEAPEHKVQDATSTPAKPKDTPKATPKAPEPQKAPESVPGYPPDAPDDPVDLTTATEDELTAYYRYAEADLGEAASLSDLKAKAAVYLGDKMTPEFKKEMLQLVKNKEGAINALGGVRRLPPIRETKYQRAKANISKAIERLVKSVRDMQTKPKDDSVLTPAEKKRGITNDGRDPASSPAGKHLAAGGSVDDAPSDGLWEAIEADPSRFKIKTKKSGEGSASETHIVTDTKTDQQFFFKRALNGAEVAAGGDLIDPMIYGDGANEIVAADLGNAAFPGLFLPVAYAQDSIDPQPMLKFQHFGEYVKERGGKDPILDEMYDINPLTGEIGLKKGVKPLEDGKQALRIHIFDYLTANADRHGSNLAHYTDKDGKRVLVPIDHGASFHAMTKQVEGNPETGDQTLLQPETVPYDQWQTGWNMNLAFLAKGRIIRAEIMAAYGDNVDAIRADAEKIINDLKKVKTQKILADLRKKYPSLDAYERAHMEGAIKIWENRMTMIDADDVATVMSK